MSAPACRVLRAYGRTVALEADDGVLDELLSRLPPSYRSTSGQPEQTFTVGPFSDSGATLSALELWVAEHARRRIFVHAGCVVWHGRAILLPGRTLAGKSSLTAALVRAGATYYSDEYAVLDAQGMVRPYARPLSIRPYDGGVPRRVGVDELGGSSGTGAAPVGMVAHLRYADGLQLSDVSRAQSVLHLLDNTVPARSRPRAVMNALTAAVGDAITVTGSRADADETAVVLMDRLQ